MPNYPIPENPVYNPEITQLQDTDPASATNTFNPLFQKLINNTHAVKKTADALKLEVAEINTKIGDSTQIHMQDGKTLEESYADMLTELESAQAELDGITAQVKAITGFDIAGAVATASDLPDPTTLAIGTQYAVEADETHGGRPTVYEVVSTQGVNAWNFLAEMGINLDDYVDKGMLGAANGAASLGSDGKLPSAQVPALPIIGSGYGTSSTAAGTAAKVGTLASFVLKVGGRVGLKFTNADSSTNPTLNVNSTGAKPIFYNGARITPGMIAAGWLAEFIYDGTNWNLLNPAAGGAGSAGGFVLRCTFGSTLAGKAFTVTASGYSSSGTVPAGLLVDVVVPTENTVYTVTCDGNSKTITTGQYFGIYPIKVEAISSNFGDNTWAQIADAVASGAIPSGWNVGDTKDIVVSGETLTVQIYGFNHDDLTSGGKAPITFGLKNLMATTRRMEATNTNVNSFTGSEMYIWLRDTLLPSLPADLRNVIKPVNKKTSAGNQSATIKTESMKIFLFSEVECFGATTYSVAGEGSQYPIFTDNTSRIKYLSNGAGSAFSWWERSPFATYAATFCSVNSDGSAANYGASTAWGVCFGFCI